MAAPPSPILLSDFGDTYTFKLWTFAALILSLSFHEFAHAFVAKCLGDRTAADLGRATLNPLPHLSPTFSVVIPLFLILYSPGFLIGAGKPVPVDPRNLRRPALGLLLVSAAGPLMNLLLALLVTLAYRVGVAAGWVQWETAPSYVLYLCIDLNLRLAVFNLIPAPPLDGHRILGFFLPGRLREWYSRQLWIGLLVMAWLFLGGFAQLNNHVLVPLARVYRHLMPWDLQLYFPV